MINPFHIKVTLGKWFITPDGAPVEVVNEKNMQVGIDPTQMKDFAHLAALIDAYPDYVENLGNKVANNLQTIINHEANANHDTVTSEQHFSVTSHTSANTIDNYEQEVIRRNSSGENLPKNDNSKPKTKSKHDPHALSVFGTQLEHLHIPIWSLPSHIQYLFSRFYYSVALKAMQQNSLRIWAIPLFISWALYRVVDAARFVVGLVISPLPFALTLVLRSTVAGARLVGTWLTYAFANIVNRAVNFMNRVELKEKDERNGSAEPIPVPDKFKHMVNNNSTDDNPTIVLSPPDLLDAWTDFLKRLKSAWKDSKAYVLPIQRKLDHVINPLRQKAKTNTLWFVPIALFAALTLGAAAFLDFVAIEAIIRISENRPFDTQFFDMIGGGYATIAWDHIASWATIAGNAIAYGATVAWENAIVYGATVAWENASLAATLSVKAIGHALTPSWDKIEVGMKFFGYFVTQNALAFGISSMVITLGVIAYYTLKGIKKNEDDPIHISNTSQGWTLNTAFNATSEGARRAMMYTPTAPVVKANAANNTPTASAVPNNNNNHQNP